MQLWNQLGRLGLATANEINAIFQTLESDSLTCMNYYNLGNVCLQRRSCGVKFSKTVRNLKSLK